MCNRSESCPWIFWAGTRPEKARIVCCRRGAELVFIWVKTLLRDAVKQQTSRKLTETSRKEALGSTLAYAGADSESGASSAVESGRFWQYSSSWSGMKSPSSSGCKRVLKMRKPRRVSQVLSPSSGLPPFWRGVQG